MNILISPLNWGLGHATRLVPIIRKLIENNNKVIIAGDGQSIVWLKNYFSNIEIVHFPSFNFKYSKKGIKLSDYFILANQIVCQTLYENQKIKNILKLYSIDLIISDNRYGFYSNTIPSFLITHQLDIILPNKLMFAKTLINMYLKKYFQKFDKIFIPDFEDFNKSLAGALSHHKNEINVPIKYIGPLSRFSNKKMIYYDYYYDILILVSAPTKYMYEIVNLLDFYADLYPYISFAMITPYNFYSNRDNLTFIVSPCDDEWLATVLGSKKIISIAGYSTIMDLYTIKKSAILIPVQGQTEQMYLANFLDGKHNFKSVDSLKSAIELAIMQFIIK